MLLGQVAGDDPEGQEVYESLLDERSDRIMLLSKEDTALVNALQRKAAVVFQKSLPEGFGLTVSEAMWKETPVIGGDVGGIPLQIQDGENGFLVSSIEEAADRIVQLVDNPDLAERMGKAARQTVVDDFFDGPTARGLPRFAGQLRDPLHPPRPMTTSASETTR